MADIGGVGPELVGTSEGPSLRYKGKWLYSQRAPVGRAIAILESIAAEEECLYLVPSPCLCYGITELAGRLPASSAILAVETDEALYSLAEESLRNRVAEYARPEQTNTYKAQGNGIIAHKGLVTVDAYTGTSIALLLYRSDEALFVAVNHLGKFRRVREVRLSSGWTLDPETYGALPGKILEYFSEYYRSRMTAVRMGRLWLRNTIKNLLRLPETPSPVPSTEKPVLVCGAGLSLYRALPWIREERKNLYILSCDTAFGTLRAAGIRPDSIVCLDAQLYNLLDLIGYAEDQDGKPMHTFIDISAHPSFFLGIRGAITPVLTLWSKSRFMRDLASTGYNLQSMPPLGSVGLSSLYLAAKLKSPAIFLTGLDFSFIPGHTHAPSTLMDTSEFQKENRLYRRDNSWTHSFREGSHEISQGWRSDPALEMYASLCCELVASMRGEHTLFDLRGGIGIDLGLERHEGAELGTLVRMTAKAFATANSTRLSSGDNPMEALASSIDTKVLSSLLEDTYKNIIKLREELRGGSDRKFLLEQIRKLDFLYIHFPDSERVLALEQDSLNRLAFECEYWARFMEQELGGLG